MILDILINTAITIGGAAGAVAIITGLEKLKKANAKANEETTTSGDIISYQKPGGGWFVAMRGDVGYLMIANAYKHVTGLDGFDAGYAHTGYAIIAPVATESAGRLAWETSVIEDMYKGATDDQGRQRITFVSTP